MTQTALLFPGQGAHDLTMLDDARHAPNFSERYAVVCNSLESDPLAELAAGNTDYLNRNKVSSTLTVLVSSLALDNYLENNSPPTHLGGYSIGQWTALYASGALSFAELASIVSARADVMDACFADGKGGMAAFLGVHPTKLTEYLQTLREQGHDLVISNYNCLGNYSVAGPSDSIKVAVAGAAILNARKVAVLPVQGAWHCSLLESAEKAFAEHLLSVDLGPFHLPVLDNTTGELLSEEPEVLRGALARHISHPVQWEKGIRTLIGFGCDNFVEVGFGEVLTKFGFFIDRDKNHLACGTVRSGG